MQILGHILRKTYDLIKQGYETGGSGLCKFMIVGIFSTTREGPDSKEALYPPPINSEIKGWQDESFSFEVTKFYVRRMFHSL